MGEVRGQACEGRREAPPAERGRGGDGGRGSASWWLPRGHLEKPGFLVASQAKSRSATRKGARGVGWSQGPSPLRLSQAATAFVGVQQLLHLNLALPLWTQPPRPSSDHFHPHRGAFLPISSHPQGVSALNFPVKRNPP